MPRLSFLSLLLLLAPLATPAANAPAAALAPLPARMELDAGGFDVDARTGIDAEGEAAHAVAERLNDFLAAAGQPRLRITRGGAIVLRLDPSADLPAEGYRLQVDGKGVRVIAAAEAGLFHGATTLWQLLVPAQQGRVRVPALRIEDAPRFGWRGFMLDSARQFHSVEQVKRLLDVMALHKLNVFHWHLTDDQGWRIEIKRYPRLTSVGACRVPVGDDAIDPATGGQRLHCGHYSQQDIRDIVAYAAQRHITVVPEIDVPGHATAAIAAYPELGSTGQAIEVTAQRGIHPNLFNVEASTFEFLRNVFAEVAGLFPGRYVHVGGDEAIKDQWRASPRIQQRIRELGLKDEAELQGWFMRRLEDILEAQGKQLLGWDEIVDSGLPPRATVMSWRGTEGGLAAARGGHDVVMSPVSHVYFDYLATDAPDEYPGRPSPRLLPMEKVYAFEPVPEALEPALHRHILGLQANMWTTENRGFDGVLHNSFPRLLAVAETGWTPADRKDYADFLRRLPAWLPRYQALGIGYARTLFQAQLQAALLPGGEASTRLSTPLGYALRYAIDDGDWAEYRQPLERIGLPAVLRVQVLDAAGAPLSTQSFELDHTGLLGRGNAQLPACDAKAARLRMEDDGPAEGPRARFNIDFMAPCWSWPDAPLRGIAAVEVRAGRIPYWIRQGAEEDARRRYLPARTAHGELDIRAGGCEGEPVASAPLPDRPGADGFATLRAPLSRKIDENATLCIRFSGDTRPDMWWLDHIQLVPGQ